MPKPNLRGEGSSADALGGSDSLPPPTGLTSVPCPCGSFSYRLVSVKAGFEVACWFCARVALKADVMVHQ